MQTMIIVDNLEFDNLLNINMEDEIIKNTLVK